MTAALEVHHVTLSSVARLRQLLDLLAELRTLQWPIRTSADLRQAIGALLRLAELVGLDEAWRRQLENILLDEGILRIVLAVAQYVLGSGGVEAADGTLRVTVCADGALPGAEHSESLLIDEQTLIAWLPLVVQLLRLLSQLRETR